MNNTFLRWRYIMPNSHLPRTADGRQDGNVALKTRQKSCRVLNGARIKRKRNDAPTNKRSKAASAMKTPRRDLNKAQVMSFDETPRGKLLLFVDVYLHFDDVTTFIGRNILPRDEISSKSADNCDGWTEGDDRIDRTRTRERRWNICRRCRCGG